MGHLFVPGRRRWCTPCRISPGESSKEVPVTAVGWFLDNMSRAFASMADEGLNNVSETLNEEMDKRHIFELRQAGALEADEVQGTHFRWGRSQSRPAAEHVEQDGMNEPGSRTRSRSKAIARRRAQCRADHGLPPWEEEQAAAAQETEKLEEVQLGEADFSTDTPPPGGNMETQRGQAAA